jgi:hypothetical protein
MSKERLIIIAAVIISIALAYTIVKRHYAAMDPISKVTLKNLPPPPGGIVSVEAAAQRCDPGDTCIMVDSSCGLCCKFISINAKMETAYNVLFGDSCHNYKGKMCNCADTDSWPACINGKCTLVTWLK